MNATSPVARPLVRRPLVRRLLAAAALAIVATQGVAIPAVAADEPSFVTKEYRIEGGWNIVQEGGQTLIRFDEGFSTKGGPDLKVFLSPKTIDEANGDNATEGSLLLGELQSTTGAQDYLVPEGVSLEDFGSVLVHCEKFGVLWGGGELGELAAAP